MESLGLEFLDFFEVLVLAEDLACSLQELSEAIISHDVGLLQEAFLDLVVQLFLKLVPGLVHFLNDVSDCLLVVILEHLANDGCDIGSEVHIEIPLTLLDLIPELISMDLVGLAFDLLAAHAGEQHLLLRQVDILVLFDGGPNVLHELREVSDWYVVIDELFVVGAVDEELFEALDALVPVLLLPLLQLGRQEEHLQLEHVRQVHVGFVGRLGDLAPGIIHLSDELLLQRLRVLLLLHEIPHHEHYLLRLLGSEQLQVQLKDDLEYLELRALEGADLLYPDVDEQGMRDGECEQRVPPLNFLNGASCTVRSSRSLESLPSTSRMMIFEGDSTLNQMPFVVWPTRCFLFSTSKSVPKRALSRVLLPELCEPMIESIWYFL